MTKGVSPFNDFSFKKEKGLIMETNEEIVQRPGISIFSLMWSFSWYLSLNVGGFFELCYFWKGGMKMLESLTK